MKTTARTLIILLAAGLISLGWYAYSTTASSQTSMPERPTEFAATDTTTDTTDQTPPTRPEGDEHNEQSFSISRVLGGMAGTIGQTALVIALVVLARKLGNWVGVRYQKKTQLSNKLNAPPHLN